MGFLDGRSLFLGLFLVHSSGNEFGNFRLVHFVEGHIAVAYEMVAFDSGRFRSFALEELLPGKHRLADMHSAVIDDSGFNDRIAACSEYLRHRITQKVISDVAKMQGLVGVGRGELDHNPAAG